MTTAIKNSLGAAIATASILCALMLAQGCALFAPSKEDLMAYCVADPTVKKRAADLGMTPEELCERLLRDGKDSADAGAKAGDACVSGGCPLR